MFGARSLIMVVSLTASVTASATAQQGVFVTNGEPIGLVSMPDVQRTLNLDEEQVKKANSATESALARIREAGKETRSLEKDKAGEAFLSGTAKIAADYKKEVASILKPEQARRLRAIAIQRYQWEVFRDPDFRDEMKLTDEQRVKIDEVLSDTQKEMLAISRLRSDPQTRKDAVARAKELNERVLKDLVGLLNDAQKKQWQEMLLEGLELERIAPLKEREKLFESQLEKAKRLVRPGRRATDPTVRAVEEALQKVRDEIARRRTPPVQPSAVPPAEPPGR